MDNQVEELIDCLDERLDKLESAVGTLALQVEQFARTGLADADNTFSCKDFDKQQESEAINAFYGSLVR